MREIFTEQRPPSDESVSSSSPLSLDFDFSSPNLSDYQRLAATLLDRVVLLFGKFDKHQQWIRSAGESASVEEAPTHTNVQESVHSLQLQLWILKFMQSAATSSDRERTSQAPGDRGLRLIPGMDPAYGVELYQWMRKVIRTEISNSKRSSGDEPIRSSAPILPLPERIAALERTASALDKAIPLLQQKALAAQQAAGALEADAVSTSCSAVAMIASAAASPAPSSIPAATPDIRGAAATVGASAVSSLDSGVMADLTAIYEQAVNWLALASVDKLKAKYAKRDLQLIVTNPKSAGTLIRARALLELAVLDVQTRCFTGIEDKLQEAIKIAKKFPADEAGIFVVIAAEYNLGHSFQVMGRLDQESAKKHYQNALEHFDRNAAAIRIVNQPTQDVVSRCADALFAIYSEQLLRTRCRLDVLRVLHYHARASSTALDAHINKLILSVQTGLQRIEFIQPKQLSKAFVLKIPSGNDTKQLLYQFVATYWVTLQVGLLSTSDKALKFEQLQTQAKAVEKEILVLQSAPSRAAFLELQDILLGKAPLTPRLLRDYELPTFAEAGPDSAEKINDIYRYFYSTIEGELAKPAGARQRFSGTSETQLKKIRKHLKDTYSEALGADWLKAREAEASALKPRVVSRPEAEPGTEVEATVAPSDERALATEPAAPPQQPQVHRGKKHAGQLIPDQPALDRLPDTPTAAQLPEPTPLPAPATTAGSAQSLELTPHTKPAAISAKTQKVAAGPHMAPTATPPAPATAASAPDKAALPKTAQGRNVPASKTAATPSPRATTEPAAQPAPQAAADTVRKVVEVKAAPASDEQVAIPKTSVAARTQQVPAPTTSAAPAANADPVPSTSIKPSAQPAPKAAAVAAPAPKTSVAPAPSPKAAAADPTKAPVYEHKSPPCWVASPPRGLAMTALGATTLQEPTTALPVVKHDFPTPVIASPLGGEATQDGGIQERSSDQLNAGSNSRVGSHPASDEPVLPDSSRALEQTRQAPAQKAAVASAPVLETMAVVVPAAPKATALPMPAPPPPTPLTPKVTEASAPYPPAPTPALSPQRQAATRRSILTIGPRPIITPSVLPQAQNPQVIVPKYMAVDHICRHDEVTFVIDRTGTTNAAGTTWPIIKVHIGEDIDWTVDNTAKPEDRALRKIEVPAGVTVYFSHKADTYALPSPLHHPIQVPLALSTLPTQLNVLIACGFQPDVDATTGVGAAGAGSLPRAQGDGIAEVVRTVDDSNAVSRGTNVNDLIALLSQDVVAWNMLRILQVWATGLVLIDEERGKIFVLSMFRVGAASNYHWTMTQIDQASGSRMGFYPIWNHAAPNSFGDAAVYPVWQAGPKLCGQGTVRTLSALVSGVGNVWGVDPRPPLLPPSSQAFADSLGLPDASYEFTSSWPWSWTDTLTTANTWLRLGDVFADFMRWQQDPTPEHLKIVIVKAAQLAALAYGSMPLVIGIGAASIAHTAYSSGDWHKAWLEAQHMAIDLTMQYTSSRVTSVLLGRLGIEFAALNTDFTNKLGQIFYSTYMLTENVWRLYQESDQGQLPSHEQPLNDDQPLGQEMNFSAFEPELIGVTTGFTVKLAAPDLVVD